MPREDLEGSDVSFHESDRQTIKEFKLYFTLLVNSFNEDHREKEQDYMQKLSRLIEKLEADKLLSPSIKKMIERVKYIQNHIENMQGIEAIDPEIKKIQESLDKMG